MARRPNELFDKNKIKKQCENVSITPEQSDAALEWLKLLKEDKLRDEEQNKSKFERIILERILGYTVYDYIPEKDFVDYIVTDKSSGTSLCIERKGTSTKSLDSLQKGRGKEHETPIKQTWVYMGLGHDYGICTNYNEFAILLSQEKTWTKSHRFKFESIEDPKNQINEEKLKEFIGLFSKERIFTEKIYETLSKQTIDAEEEFTEEFYKLYHETRLMLIKEFRKGKSDKESKKTAVHWAQKFLNRLIFIFFVEDHNFIPKKIFTDRLINILQSPSLDENSQTIYDNIKDLFKKMNVGSKILGINEFNGGLFAEEIPSELFFSDLHDDGYFKEEKQNSKLSKKSLSVDLHIGISSLFADSVSPIIKNFLIMDSYDFTSDANVNILGHIFEQSISDLEKISEEDTSKRKKFGVYYTPNYITDYICRDAIISYLSKKSSKHVEELVKEYEKNLDELKNKIKNLKILDPACGSGAFLVKAVDILLEIDNEIDKYKPDSPMAQKDMSEYTKPKEINEFIENNIYGVDINEESIEITKLSLFLKLAGTNRKLSYLSNNIKVGNSLIDVKSIDEHAFSWKDEFPEILNPLIKNNGFDIIIGNPPYIRQELFKEIKPFLKKEFESYNSISDLYVYFIERGIKLLKTNGFISFIIPNKFLKTGYGKQLRIFLKKNTKIHKFYDFDDFQVFSDVTTYPLIFVIQKPEIIDDYEFTMSKLGDKNTLFPLNELETSEFKVSSKVLNNEIWDLSDTKTSKIIKTMETKSITLDEFVSKKIFYGIKTGRNNIFVIDKKTKNELIKDQNAKKFIKKVVTGTEVKRYRINFDEKYILFLPWEYDLESSTSIKEYLLKHKLELEKRSEVKTKRYNWWVLTRYGSENAQYLEETKIIYPRISNTSNFCLDKSGEIFITDNNFYISSSSKSLLAVLNSNLVFYYLMQKCPSLRGGFYDFRREYIQRIPIHRNLDQFKKELEQNADSLLEKNRNIQEIENKFFNRIYESFKPKKLSKKIKEFYKLELAQFISEIKKISEKKIQLSEWDEWEDYFNKKKKQLCDLKTKIIENENTINKLVYKLYTINDNQIKIIENSINRQL